MTYRTRDEFTHHGLTRQEKEQMTYRTRDEFTHHGLTRPGKRTNDLPHS